MEQQIESQDSHGSLSNQQSLDQLLVEVIDDPDDGNDGDDGSIKNKSLFNFSTNFTNNELVVLISVLSSFSKNDFYIKLYSLFGRESILFLSIFNGNTLKIPDVKYLLKLRKFTKIYLFLKEYNFEEDAYVEASRIFKKPVEDLKRIVGKVISCMEVFKESIT